MENLESSGGGGRRHRSTNRQRLILSDNLRKAHRNSKEMIHFSSFWPRLKRLSSGAGRNNPAPAAVLLGELIGDLNSLLTWASLDKGLT